MSNPALGQTTVMAGLRHHLPNISWLFAGKIIRMGLAMAAGIAVARYLGAEVFGTLSYATAFALLARPLATFQLEGICVRELVKAPDKEGEILGSALVLSLVAGTLCFGLTSGAILLIRPQDTLTCAMVALAGTGLIFACLETFDFHFQARVKARPAVTARTLALGTVSLAKLAAVFFAPSPLFFALMVLAESLAGGLALFLVFRRHAGPIALRPRMDRIRTLMADAWPLALSGMAAAVYLRIDKIMLGELLDDQAVGIYTAAVRLAEAWYVLPVSIMTSLYPAVVRSLKEKGKNKEGSLDPGEARDRMVKIYRLMVVTGVIAGGLTWSLADPLVVLLYGDAFREAGPILAGYGWSVIFVGIAMAKAAWLKAMNLTRIQFAATLAGAVVNIGLNLALIPSYGPMGAVWATLVSYAVEAWLVLFYFDGARSQAKLIWSALTFNSKKTRS